MRRASSSRADSEQGTSLTAMSTSVASSASCSRRALGRRPSARAPCRRRRRARGSWRTTRCAPGRCAGRSAWLAMRESASRRSRVLPMPGAPVTVTTMRRPRPRRTARTRPRSARAPLRAPRTARRPTFSRRPRDGRAHHRAPVAAQLQLEPAARQLGGSRVGEDLPARRVARQSGGTVHDLARGPRAVDARASRRHAHRSVQLGDAKAQIERSQRLVAQRLSHAEVADDGVAAELGRVGAACAQVR